ncbi:hypothetical protein Bbelb_309940 [Branchiostoma belcheri]|nr:hypothetical protein Bbelb_309940 [Branchiostoma belcheri]
MQCVEQVWESLCNTIHSTAVKLSHPPTLQGDLDNLSTWTETNRMKLNPGKCKALQVCFVRIPPPPPAVMNLKLLMQFHLPTHDLVTVYTSFVRPVLEYAIPLWHPGLTSSQRRKIENIQVRATKIILGNTFHSYSAACEALQLQKLEDRRVSLCLKFAQKLYKSEQYRHWFPRLRGEITKTGETIIDKEKQMSRWVEHYLELYSQESAVSQDALDSIDDLPVIAELDAEPTMEE